MEILQQQAVEIEIRAAEWGESPYQTWDECPWSDRVSYTVNDQAEAAVLFGTDPVEAFQDFVCDLDDQAFCEVTRAIRTLREAVTRYHAEKSEHDPVVTVQDILEAF